MTRREKIILGVTGVVAVLALGSLFFGDGPPAKPSPAVTAKADPGQIPALAKSVEEASLGASDVAMLSAIGRPWREAAFYDRSLEGKGQAAKPSSLPRYTGFVELGSGRLAVVDGYEYQVGDSLEGGGYKVVAITPDRVTLESLANGNRVDVPYEGQEALAR